MQKLLRRVLAIALSLTMLLSILPLAGAEETAEILLPNGDFENGDAANWILTGLPQNPVRSNEWNTPNPSWTLNLWAHDTEQVEIHASYPVKLTAGEYHFSFDISGEGKDSNLRWSIKAGESVLAEAEHSVTTVDWNVWNTIQTDSFVLSEPTEIVFDFGGTGPVKYWGDLDNLRLFGTGAIYEEPAPVREIAIPNGDFENGTSGWTLSGLSDDPILNNQYSAVNATNVLNLWASDTEESGVAARYFVRLTAGTYYFTYRMDGENRDGHLSVGVNRGEESFPMVQHIVTQGWDNWQSYQTEEFTLEQSAEISFRISGTIPAGYWAHLDDLKLFGTGAVAEPEIELDHTPTLAVEKVQGVESADFMRGTDVSSYLSIVNSGAKYYDYDGNALTNQGFFDLLADAGFNYIRLRVWNDPFDAQGRGYGGGNCDVNAALTMGQWATNAGMKVLIDFHYSDFWADPGKQKAPKAWSEYSLAQKVEAVDDFTYTSLKTLLDGGVDVGMVQVGNETTNSICGESSWANKAQIFSAGSAAVRRIAEKYEHPILVAIHFTNPERSGNYASQAQNLNNYNVDYDVFASSWYPYWHGSTANLTSVLKQVAETYGKQVIVAETSWAWTLDDGDGHENTVRVGKNDGNAAYSFSRQGQADELVSAVKAIKAVGEAGVGVFYWENAWIPVQYAYDENGARDEAIYTANKEKWEQFGSGWASSYAAEYDPNDAGRWYGGSAVDNQAMFDFTGKALDSLWTWKYMMVGTEELIEKQVESVEQLEISVELGESLNLPATVKVSYNVGAAKDEAVSWNNEELAAADVNTPGVYTVHGVVTLSYDLGTAETLAVVTVNYPNLLQNPGFELEDMSMYSLSGGSRTGDDPHSGSKSVHWYNSDGGVMELSQSLTLEPGVYSFSLYAQGDGKGSTDMYLYADVNGERETQSFALAGWAVWQHPEVSFTVSETCSVTVGVHLAYGAGGWGTIDDLSLRRSVVPDPVPELPIIYKSISIGAELSIVYNFRADAMESFDSWYLQIEKLDAEGNVLAKYCYGEAQDYDLEWKEGYWFAVYDGVSAKEMGVTVRARLVGLDAGENEIVGEACEDSIRSYLLELLMEEGRDSQRVLCADLLNYGAAAQIYFDFDTEHLVNEELTPEQAAAMEQYATKEEAPAEQTNSPEGPTLYSSVSLKNRVILSLSAVVRNAQGEVSVRITDPDGSSVELPMSAVSAKVYIAKFSNVSAKNMRKPYEIKVLVDENDYGTPITWSVEGYIHALRENGGDREIALANAMLIYGDSAAKYLNER